MNKLNTAVTDTPHELRMYAGMLLRSDTFSTFSFNKRQSFPHSTAEIGDFDPQKHYGNYISDFKILLKQTPKMEEKIMEYHPTLKGQTPLMAETCFLKKASLLDTYGVDPHPVKVFSEGYEGTEFSKLLFFVFFQCLSFVLKILCGFSFCLY